MLKAFKGVIIGAPASGKGTISSRIIKCFDVKHVSSGDVLRNHMLQNSEFGMQIQDYVNEGKLVPDTLMVSLMQTELSLLGSSNWILDGFPRTKEQAEELSTKEHLDVALNLVVPFDVIIDRVKGRWIHEPSGRIYNMGYSPPKIHGKDDLTGEDLIQRPDDLPEAVKKRLEIYASNIEPVLEYYRRAGILKQFLGKTSNEIWPNVYNFLSEFMEAKAELKIG